jgi:hypothetical protein
VQKKLFQKLNQKLFGIIKFIIFGVSPGKLLDFDLGLIKFAFFT